LFAYSPGHIYRGISVYHHPIRRSNTRKEGDRNIALLAKQSATLHEISNGRFEFRTGAGATHDYVRQCCSPSSSSKFTPSFMFKHQEQYYIISRFAVTIKVTKTLINRVLCIAPAFKYIEKKSLLFHDNSTMWFGILDQCDPFPLQMFWYR
jgi:hypothetical protein